MTTASDYKSYITLATFQVKANKQPIISALVFYTPGTHNPLKISAFVKLQPQRPDALYLVEATLFALANLRVANAIGPQSEPQPAATDRISCPNITAQSSKSSEPYQVGYSAVHAEEPLSITKTHTEGTTWTVGADIGLTIEGVIGLGLSASVSKSVDDGTGEGGVKTCPPGGEWRCGLLLYQALHVVEGFNNLHLGSCKGRLDGESKPYKVEIPIQDKDGNPKFRLEVCACKNYGHWSDPGAPSIVCIEDCA